MEPGATPRDQRRSRLAWGASHGWRTSIEAAALALLAALPLLPYLLSLAKDGIPRFAFTGDYAGLELATRLVPTGRTLLGPYSRFGFSHPGPLYFFEMAPIYALWGGSSTGLFASACAVNAIAAMTMVAAVRMASTRAHAIAVTLVVLAWLASYGTACALPWNPLVVVLPLIAFLVLAALVARGSVRLAPIAVFFGALVAETHLSTVPTVVGVTVATIAVVAVKVRRGRHLDGGDRRCLVAAAVVLALVSAPPLVEQLTAREGNLSKLAHFFLHRTEPLKPLDEALRDWTQATSWLPDRLLERSLQTEGPPSVMGSEAASAHLSTTAFRLTILLAVGSLGAGALAWRRRDTVSLALLGMGAFACLLAVAALRAIIGTNYVYLLFWTTAASTVLWMGIAGAMVTALVPLSTRARPLAVVAVLVAAAGSTSLQRAWLANNALAPRTYEPMRDVYQILVADLTRTGRTPVIHASGAWHIGMSFLLEMSKDGMVAATVERDRWILGRQTPTVDGLPPAAAARVVHVYARTASHALEMANCLHSFAKSGDVELMTSEIDVIDCPAGTPP